MVLQDMTQLEFLRYFFAVDSRRMDACLFFYKIGSVSMMHFLCLDFLRKQQWISMMGVPWDETGPLRQAPRSMESTHGPTTALEPAARPGVRRGTAGTWRNDTRFPSSISRGSRFFLVVKGFSFRFHMCVHSDVNMEQFCDSIVPDLHSNDCLRHSYHPF